MVNNSGYIAIDKATSDELVKIIAANMAALAGYDASKTQVLKNVEGVLTWVEESST